MPDMPSYGSSHELEYEDLADDCFLLLTDNEAHQLSNIQTMRRVLATDPDALAAMLADRSSRSDLYDAIRNLHVFANSLKRLADVAFDRLTEAIERTHDGTPGAAANGAASRGDDPAK